MGLFLLLIHACSAVSFFGGRKKILSQFYEVVVTTCKN